MKFFFRIIPKLLIILFFSNSALSSESEFEKVLTDNFKLITKSSSKTVEPVIEKLLNSNFSKVEEFLKFWKNKKLIFSKKTKVMLAIRTTANSLTTRFHVIKWEDEAGLPTVEVQLLAEDFAVASSAPCVSRWVDGSPEATCDLGVLNCSDDPFWTNGQGKSCADYSKEGWCAGGRAAPGAEWTLGSQFAFPEERCCACGKRIPSKPAVQRHVTMRVVGPETTALTRTSFN